MDDYYQTGDLYFAAYLMVAGVEYHDMVCDDGDSNRMVFEFESQGHQAMQALKRDYFSGKAKVPAKAYADAIRNMKSLLHM